jgi:nucleoside-diphosphate-sugar epimerase
MVRTDVVVHAAARVHVMRERATDALAEFRRVNVDATLGLARQAAAAGVRRFIYLSSIKVNGEHTPRDGFFRSGDSPKPEDAYGRSKAEAEDALRALSAQTGLEVVVVRPVLVYGPGAKGNLETMMRWLLRGIPLPFGAVDNRRSLVGLDNLEDVIDLAIRHPEAANRTLLVSDGDDLSTAQLLRLVARGLDVSPRLVPVPSALVGAAARAVGKKALAQRLLGSLRVDISETRRLLGWTPRVAPGDGLRSMAEAFLATAAR